MGFDPNKRQEKPQSVNNSPHGLLDMSSSFLHLRSKKHLYLRYVLLNKTLRIIEKFTFCGRAEANVDLVTAPK